MTLTISNSGRYEMATQQISFTDTLLQEYAAQLDTQSAATKKTYMKSVNDFVAWVKEREISAVDYDTIVIYKKHLVHHEQVNETTGEIVIKELSAKTVNLHLAAIKNLFSFLERKGFVNAAKNVKKEKVSNDFVRDSLTIDQVQQILNSIDTSTLNGARAYAIFYLLVKTGLRECEITRANVCDITNRGNKSILKIQGKGHSSKDDLVEIKPNVMQALQNYFIKRGNVKPNEPLFTSTSNHNNGGRLTTRTVQRIVKDLYAKNGIVSKNITTHSTRHTAATLAYVAGADIPHIQAMLRHKNINTTMIYAHMVDRLEENNAESVLDKLF